MPKSVFSPKYRAFLDYIAQARRAAGLTQVELASRLGKPQSFVSKAESGERRLDFVEVVDLAHALGLEPLEFVTGLLAQKAFR